MPLSPHTTPHPTPAPADSSSQLLNEIMPMIYKRFTEKSSEEWRQIYKVRAATTVHWRC